MTMTPLFRSVLLRGHVPHLSLQRVSCRSLSKKAAAAGPHALNCAKVLSKGDAGGKHFSDLIQLPVHDLQGIGPKHENELKQLGIKTIENLANYKFFHLARSIVTLAETEVENGRLEDAVMNIDKGVDKAYEQMSFNDIKKQPVQALLGISEEAGLTFKLLGVSTVADLANFKYCRWAEAIVTAAKFEQK